MQFQTAFTQGPGPPGLQQFYQPCSPSLHADSASSGSWSNVSWSGEDSLGVPSRDSPLRACSAPINLAAVHMASLSIEDAMALQKAASLGVQQAATTMSVGWGGAPLQQQQMGHPAPRFRQHPQDDGSYSGGGAAGGAPYAAGPAFHRGRNGGGRGRPPPQQQHVNLHQRQGRQHGVDPRQKNQGYRRLWQQVTQVSRGQKLGNGEGGGLSEMTVEDLLEVVRRLPPEASAVKAINQGLYYLDSGALAALLKELNKSGHVRRAQEIFDWLRTLDDTHDLYHLCNTMTFTTAISQCGSQQQLRRALELVAEMRSRGIQCNVHTYSALMNVCIKGNELDLALDVYRQMLAEGCTPNLVTYNTLIDVYGKTGAWEEAIRVLDALEAQGIDPEIRTYNTVIIACNMSGQAQEALRIYERMLAAGAQPTSTTMTALISAYGKNGQLDRALQIFQDMVRRGCERNVITYSSLISACEKAGRWELALELFREMHTEGCRPNVVTFNSLIAACAQGAQWEKAQELFEQMQHRGCKPDSVTFGGLISAYDRAGQWRRALAAFEQMKGYGCRPDSVVYNTVVGALWRTGLVWAQAKATQIFHAACRQGHFRLTVHTLDAAAAAAPSAAPSPLVAGGLPPRSSSLSSALAQEAAAALPVTAAGPASCGGFGRASAAPSPDLPRPPTLSLGSGGSGDLCSGPCGGSGSCGAHCDGPSPSPDLLSPLSCATPALPATPTATLTSAYPAPGSPSPSGSPLSEAALAAAAACGGAVPGSGAGTLIEFGMHAFTVGSAVLSLLRWVAELRERLPREPAKDLQQQVCLVLNKGKPSREHTYPSIRAALLSLLTAWRSPFALADVPQGCRIQATACDITDWLHTAEADRALAAYCAKGECGGRPLAKEAFFQDDVAAEARCMEAFCAVRAFEARYCVPDAALPPAYLAGRGDWFATGATFAAAFSLKGEVLHDALLLLDRAVAAGGEQLLGLNAAALLVACLLISARQAGEHPDRLPAPAQLEQATGLSGAAVEATQATVRAVLQGDTSAISALRVLKLMLERLGADFGNQRVGHALAALNQAACQPALRAMRPSALAAAVLLASRKATGATPFWPSTLAGLTGCMDAEGSQLSADCDQVVAALADATLPAMA